MEFNHVVLALSILALGSVAFLCYVILDSDRKQRRFNTEMRQEISGLHNSISDLYLSVRNHRKAIEDAAEWGADINVFREVSLSRNRALRTQYEETIKTQNQEEPANGEETTQT